MPIGGATAPEEGGKGSELGEFNVSVGSSSSPSKEPGRPSKEPRVPLSLHALMLALKLQGQSHLGNEGLGGSGVQTAEASDAIPKKRAKQSIKATISFTDLYNP